MRHVSILILSLFVSVAAQAAAPESVEIEGKLKGALYKPEGNGPFPAIVALHGCDGLLEKSVIAPRYADWGERLAAGGFVVLFPDSFAARGIGAQCGVGQRSLRSGRERVVDAESAKHYLQALPYVVADRVSLVGWAQGGVAALWTVRPGGAKKDGKPDFRAAVAFYPGCRRLRDTAWSARLPTLILIGAKDDWAPASYCEQMVAGAKGRSAQASIIVYPGAYHEFDRPDYPVRIITGLANSADGSGRAHVGTNAAARADAITRVTEWLRR